MPRHLASVRRIASVGPIPKADAIEVVTVDGWKVVAKKGEYRTGDLAVYLEVDSLLPVRDAYEFLRKSSYKKLADGTEGFRLRTIRLRGQISQGLLLQLAPAGDGWALDLPEGTRLAVHEGDDVTEAMGVVLYESPVPAELAGVAKGPFPSFLSKTDEERVQNLPDLFGADRPAGPLYVTEKLDGSSFTAYLYRGVLGVCSRNLELLDTPTNTLWRVARELGLEAALHRLGDGVALQGEIIGEGVQGNPYKLRGQTVRFFNLFDIAAHRNVPFPEFTATLAGLGLETVPVLDAAFALPATVGEMIEYAEGCSALREAAMREGVVVRSHDQSVSFKAISNSFLLAEA